jgi:hypothetical protein
VNPFELLLTLLGWLAVLVVAVLIIAIVYAVINTTAVMIAKARDKHRATAAVRRPTVVIPKEGDR